MRLRGIEAVAQALPGAVGRNLNLLDLKLWLSMLALGPSCIGGCPLVLCSFLDSPVLDWHLRKHQTLVSRGWVVAEVRAEEGTERDLVMKWAIPGGGSSSVWSER